MKEIIMGVIVTELIRELVRLSFRWLSKRLK